MSSSVWHILRCKNNTFSQEATESTSCDSCGRVLSGPVPSPWLCKDWLEEVDVLALTCARTVGSGWPTFLLFAGTADYLSIARLLFYSSLLLPGPLVSAVPCWTLCPIIDTEKRLLTGCPLPADGSGAVYFTLRPQTHVSCWTAHKHVSQMCTAGLWQVSSTRGDYHLYLVTDSKILGLFIFGIALSLETWSTVSPLPLHAFWLWWPLLQMPLTLALLSIQAGQGALLYHFRATSQHPTSPLWSHPGWLVFGLTVNPGGGTWLPISYYGTIWCSAQGRDAGFGDRFCGVNEYKWSTGPKLLVWFMLWSIEPPRQL